MPKFHPTYRSESLGKADSRNVCFAKSAGTIFWLPFFNPSIRKNVPDNWTKIGYSFGLVKTEN